MGIMHSSVLNSVVSYPHLYTLTKIVEIRCWRRLDIVAQLVVVSQRVLIYIACNFYIIRIHTHAVIAPQGHNAFEGVGSSPQFHTLEQDSGNSVLVETSHCSAAGCRLSARTC